MNPHTQGTIRFFTAAALAEFIAALIPKSTALFAVTEQPDGSFELTFNGGY